ncbi:hypothetical protein GY45DRAFT_1238876 [Cubamyces sp. BRFM 1775]|nr:hypothetical protein GY45DRAFT_1238876 [Cubamyces sp. BRFM 1775]
MQNPSSYYAVPTYDGGAWVDWQRSGHGGDYVQASSSSVTLEAASVGLCARCPEYAGVLSGEQPSKTFDETSPCSAIPISYTLTPPTPDSTDSDVSSSSQLSMESIPEYDDMPEIPFVSAEVAYADEWIPSDRTPAERTRIDSACDAPTFWSTIIGLKASASKSSSTSDGTASSSSVILGHTTARSLSPSRASRKRAGSVSSFASSRTKPAPAKSILSSGASVQTRRRKAPSVKFLDMPTIHYEEEECEYDEDDDAADGHGSRSTLSMSPPPKKKAKGLGGFLSFRWLFGPSKVENRSCAPSSSSSSSKSSPGRPAISGPYPLWDSPPRRARMNVNGSSTTLGAASLRSMKSTGSLRSMRSCGSRLPTPTYWPR